jgi:hypothetical protein
MNETEKDTTDDEFGAVLAQGEIAANALKEMGRLTTETTDMAVRVAAAMALLAVDAEYRVLVAQLKARLSEKE